MTVKRLEHSQRRLLPGCCPANWRNEFSNPPATTGTMISRSVSSVSERWISAECLERRRKPISFGTSGRTAGPRRSQLLKSATRARQGPRQAKSSPSLPRQRRPCPRVSRTLRRSASRRAPQAARAISVSNRSYFVSLCSLCPLWLSFLPDLERIKPRRRQRAQRISASASFGMLIESETAPQGLAQRGPRLTNPCRSTLGIDDLEAGTLKGLL